MGCIANVTNSRSITSKDFAEHIDTPILGGILKFDYNFLLPFCTSERKPILKLTKDDGLLGCFEDAQRRVNESLKCIAYNILQEIR